MGNGRTPTQAPCFVFKVNVEDAVHRAEPIPQLAAAFVSAAGCAGVHRKSQRPRVLTPREQGFDGREPGAGFVQLPAGDLGVVAVGSHRPPHVRIVSVADHDTRRMNCPFIFRTRDSTVVPYSAPTYALRAA